MESNVRSRSRRMVLGLAAAATAAGLALAGCGGTGGAVSAPSSSAAPTGTVTQPTPSDTSSAAPSTASFGSSYVYTDGLKVRVDQPVVFTPSDTAAGATPGDTVIKFQVAVTNGTSSTFDVSQVAVNVTAGSAGVQAESVVATGIDGSFSGSIVPGSTQTATFAYDLPRGSGGRVDVEVQPGFNYNSQHWVGTAG